MKSLFKKGLEKGLGLMSITYVDRVSEHTLLAVFCGTEEVLSSSREYWQ